MTDNQKIETIPLLKISVAQKFHNDLYHDGFLVHPKDTPITDEDLEVFSLWKIRSFELRGNAEECAPDDDFAISALNDSIHIIQQDMSDMRQAQALYQKICDFVKESYYTINKQVRFPVGEPLATVKQFMESIRHIGSPILRFQEFHTEADYIELHSTNSFILTVALGNAAKMPQHRLLNLGLSALFHEVGLIKFAKLINKSKNFSSQEFELQKIHVQEAINLLKVYNFPYEVLEGISQHHERLDGSGYPNGLVYSEISDFGRYIGLICSYIAMTTDQKFRESQLAHTAILALLKGAKVHYDGELVRLLVQLLSLYPVGSYVALCNGKIGRVFRNNQKNPRMPIVQILFDENYQPISRSTLIQTNNKICVNKPIPYKKMAPLIAKLEKKKS